MGSMALHNLNVQSDGNRIDRHIASTTGIAGSASGAASYKDMLSSFMNDNGDRQSNNKGRSNNSGAESSAKANTNVNNNAMSMLNNLSLRTLASPVMNYNLGAQAEKNTNESENSSEKYDHYVSMDVEHDETGNIKIVEKWHYGPGWRACRGEISTKNQVEDVIISKDKTLSASASDMAKYSGNLDAEQTISMPITSTVTVYGGDGQKYNVPVYFTRTDNGEWVVSLDTDITKSQATLYAEDGTPTFFNMQPTRVTFDENGKANKIMNGGPFISYRDNIGMHFLSLDLSEVTKKADYTTMYSTSNGYPEGKLLELNVKENGEIIGKYSNGILQLEGKIELGSKTEINEVKHEDIKTNDFTLQYNEPIIDEKDMSFQNGSNGWVKFSKGVTTSSFVIGKDISEAKIEKIIIPEIKNPEDKYYVESGLDSVVVYKGVPFNNGPFRTLPAYAMAEIQGNVKLFQEYEGRFVISGQDSDGEISIVNHENGALIIGGNDRNTIISNASDVEVIGGEGKNDIKINGVNNTVKGGNTGDKILLAYVGDSSVNCGAGDDRLDINHGKKININLNEGDNYANVQWSEDVTLIGKIGKNDFNAYESQRINFEGGNQGDKYEIKLVNNSNITCGEGNDELKIVDASDLYIDLGGGGNYIEIDGVEASSILGGAGNDDFHIHDVGNVNIYLNGGRNFIEASKGKNTFIRGGHNGDVLNLDSLEESNIKCGNGNDTINLSSGSDMEIDLGGGNNTVNFSSDKYLSLHNVEISGAGSNKYIIDTNRSLYFKNVNIDGFDNDDELQIDSENLSYEYDRNNRTLTVYDKGKALLNLTNFNGLGGKITTNGITKTLDEIIKNTVSPVIDVPANETNQALEEGNKKIDIPYIPINAEIITDLPKKEQSLQKVDPYKEATKEELGISKNPDEKLYNFPSNTNSVSFTETGNMTITNIHTSKVENSKMKVDLDIFNKSGTPGVLEVLDSSGNVVNQIWIAEYDMFPTSAFDFLENSIKQTKDNLISLGQFIIGKEVINYDNESESKLTKVRGLEIPIGTHIRITNSIDQSKELSAYYIAANCFDGFIQLFSAVESAVKLNADDDGLKYAFKEVAKKYISDHADVFIKKTMKEQINTFSKVITENPQEILKEMGKVFVSNIGQNFGKTFINTAAKITTLLADPALEKVVGTAFKAADAANLARTLRDAEVYRNSEPIHYYFYEKKNEV